MTRLLVHQLALNGVWCASVFGALWGLPGLGPALAVPWILWHLGRQRSARSEGAILLAAGAFGVLADLLLIRIGGIAYAGVPADALLGPAWIVALWMVFATTVEASFAWLRGRVGLAAALGVAGGFTSYLAGRRAGVADFDLGRPETLLCLAVVWGIGVPLLVHAVPLRDALTRALARLAGRIDSELGRAAPRSGAVSE